MLVMDLDLNTPAPAALRQVADAIGAWQRDGAALQLHPGDLGWHSLRGAEATARALRTWSRGGKLVAVGLLDGPDLLRLALSPDASDDAQLAGQMAADIDDPGRGVLGEGTASVEARGLHLLTQTLRRAGWGLGEGWTPLRQDLSQPLDTSALRAAGLTITQPGLEGAADWGEVHWSAFRGTAFGAAERRQVVDWLETLRSGPLGDRVSLLSAQDGADEVVAVAGVWTTGAGRPGLIEPLGVHADHRGKGYGVAICQAGSARLQELGCSSALVCTPSSNQAAVATYVAAGFTAETEVADLVRA